MKITKLILRVFPLILIIALFITILSVDIFINDEGNNIIFPGNVNKKISIGINGKNESIPGPVSYNGNIGFPETVEQIMERDKYLEPKELNTDAKREVVYPDRRNLPQHPDAKNESAYPPLTDDQKNKQQTSQDNPQTVSTSFTGATVLGINPTFALPADNMGAVGPTQYIVAVNGRIVTFDNTTGLADGVINTTSDNFFNSVRNGAGTSDPRIRYDRMSQKWFVVIINVSSPNRILIAVSNTSTITGGTTWLFYFISASARFYDYPTLGIDNNAVYIGTNDFNTALTAFLGCSGYVINKAGLISGSVTAYLFSLVPSAASDGPYTPQGVDNFDASATEGYFIGVSNQFFGSLVMRRVSTPGGVPTISGDISIAVNTTTYPNLVRHQGAAANRRLDALDDRLYAACSRNGRLWTAHNFDVNSSGVASYGSGRTATRWYELTNLTGVPAVNQSGTIFDPAVSNPVSYWIPTVMVSGQGHAAFIFSSAGINAYVNSATSGRLSGDVLGTTQSITTITSSSTAYVIENVDGQRWGDYSYVSLDPDDDMTMWGVMGFCDATDSYGVRVTKLMAPPPPPLTNANPPSLTPGQPSVNVIITGTPTSLGEGFYDPGSGFTNRISSAITGGVTVNSVTYNTSTQVTLNVSTVGASTGFKTVTITNPDGLLTSSSSIFQVPLPVALSSFSYSVDKRDVILRWTTTFELNNKGFDIERKKEYGSEWTVVGFLQGHGTTNDPQEYSYKDSKLETGKYNYRIKQIDYDGTYERYYLNNTVIIGVPVNADISQNYPNPFNPLTKIDYNIPDGGNVKLQVFDITGKEITLIVNEAKPAGYYTAEFNASNLSSGIYLYRLIVTSSSSQVLFNKTMKMLVIK